MRKHKLKRWVVRLLGNERTQAFTIPVFAVFLSLIAAAMLILLQGKNPLGVYMNLLQGSGILPKSGYAAYKSILTDFCSFLNAWTPMLFASLAVAVSLKAGLFNIGVSGQMLTAGFVTTLLVGYSDLPAFAAKPLAVLCAVAAGMILGAFIGFLRYRFNINEVVSTIMVNYIAQYVISFFINMYYVNPVSRQSNVVSEASRLTLMNTRIGALKVDIPLGVILAVATAFAIRFLLDGTSFGFELKSVGVSPNAARYAGMNVGRSIVLTLAISGALAGAAGVTYYLGYFASIQPRVLPATGFNSIAVALLADNHPIGIIFFSFFMSIFEKGSTYMKSVSGMESEFANVITGIILLFSAGGGYIRSLVGRLRVELSERSEGRN